MTPEPPVEEFDAEMERKYPWIEWRKSVYLSVPGLRGLACRLCMAWRAEHGGFTPVQAYEVVFGTQEEFEKHMRETHGTPTKTE